ncbi:MAG TPA: hypothetical protein VKZ49_17675 [Polyangiaceae bacterium]|nr:hypothetical protein [Polyangiaceae bacterium]
MPVACEQSSSDRRAAPIRTARCALIVAATAGFSSLVACRSESPAPAPAARVSARPSAPTSATSPAAAPAPVDDDLVPLPFEYPTVTLTAPVGSAVLAPPRGFLDEALERGVAAQTFVYYAGRLLRTGPRSSLIELRSGRRHTLPNALVIPLGPPAAAEPGDSVLTAWLSGAGMQRAQVVAGGTPQSPRVRYLDIDPDAASSQEEQLPPGSFRVLESAGEVGTSVACQEGRQHAHFVVTHRGEQQMLGLGYAGRLVVLDPKRCRALALRPKLAPGSAVFVPLLGRFTAATVRGVEEKAGRALVEHADGTGKARRSVPLMDIAESLP